MYMYTYSYTGNRHTMPFSSVLLHAISYAISTVRKIVYSVHVHPDFCCVSTNETYQNDNSTDFVNG